uniref:Uncharacterized protein n=1 Tax=Setaria digitata TaxID=48799 RepID=A0A915Q183_9BILA
MSEYETIAQLNSVEILPPPSSSFVPLPKSAKCNVNSDIWRQKKSEFVQINGLERNSNNDYAVVNNSNISNSNSNLISVNKYFDINKFEKNAKIGADTTSLSDSLNKPFIEIGENGNIPDERPKKKTRASLLNFS